MVSRDIGRPDLGRIGSGDTTITRKPPTAGGFSTNPGGGGMARVPSGGWSSLPLERRMNPPTAVPNPPVGGGFKNFALPPGIAKKGPDFTMPKGILKKTQGTMEKAAKKSLSESPGRAARVGARMGARMEKRMAGKSPEQQARIQSRFKSRYESRVGG